MSRMSSSQSGRRTRRRFSDEFKEGAVRLVLDEGKTVGAVARELDLAASALGLRVRHARAERTQGKSGLPILDNCVEWRRYEPWRSLLVRASRGCIISSEIDNQSFAPSRPESPVRRFRGWTLPADLAVVIALAISLSGCTGYRRVNIPNRQSPVAAISSQVAVGDVVRVVLVNRQRLEFRVAAVEPDGIVGKDGQRVNYADIAALERRTTDKLKTTLLIASPVLIFAAAFGVAALVFAFAGH